MANEAELVEGPYETHDFTVADGSAGTDIEKFTLMKLSDPRTAAASSAADVFAGIAASTKVGGNGKLELGLWTEGIFLLTACATPGTITAGMPVVLSGANLIRVAIAAELLTGAVIGKALETIAANTQGEVKLGGLN